MKALHDLVHNVVAGLLARHFRAIQVTILDNLAVRLTCTMWEAHSETDTVSGMFDKCDRAKDPVFLRSGHNNFIEGGNYLPILNALSARFEIEVCEGGEIRAQAFEDGLAAGDPAYRGAVPGQPEQCTITALLDENLFGYAWFMYDPLARRLEEVAARLPGLKIHLDDERDPASIPHS